MPYPMVWTDDDITELTGSAAAARGRAYAATGRVQTLSWIGTSNMLRATVIGAMAQPYTTSIAFRASRSRLRPVLAHCTCPVGVGCKHAAAVLFRARADIQQQQDRTSEIPVMENQVNLRWRAQLADLGPQAIARRRATRLELGLRFEFPAGEHSLAPALRPVCIGARGGWITSRVTWATIYWYNGDDPELDHTQAGLLRQLLAALTDRTTMFPNNAPLPLAAASGPVWPTLTALQTSGVPLVTAEPGPRIVLADELVEAKLDADRTARGLRISPGLFIGDDGLDAKRSQLLGAPASGVAHLSDDGTELSLYQLAEPLTAVKANLIRLGSSVIVPPEDEVEFTREYLPNLEAELPVISTTGSYSPPVIEPPKLSLRINHVGLGIIDLAWSWLYRNDGTEVESPISHATSGQDERDKARIIAELLAMVGPEAVIWTRPGIKELRESLTLQSTDCLDFLGRVLPLIVALDDVVVRQINARSYTEVTADPEITVETVARPDDWFDLHVLVTIGGEEVSFESLFAALAQGATTAILPSGSYFSLERPEFDQLRMLINEAKAMGPDPEKLTVSRYQVGLWDELMELGIPGKQAAAWRKTVDRLAADASFQIPPVPTDQVTLRPYQLDGFGWLSFLYDNGLGGILADDMGLGKTLQTLALVAHARSNGEKHPFLVVAPTSVVPGWASEAHRFFPELKAVTITATGSRRDAPLRELIDGADLVVTSYAIFRIDNDAFRDLEWAGLILDEAQMIKNRLSKGYQCARRLVTPFKLAITGTPLENNLMELWSIVSVTAPGLFPRADTFKQEYANPIERGGSPLVLDRLRRRLRPFMIRRTKEKVAAELPPKQEQVIELELTPAHHRIYQRYLARERQKVLGLLSDVNKNRFEILRSLTLLRQLALTPALVDEEFSQLASVKVTATLEILEEVLAGEHRVLIFSQFTSFLAILAEQLDDKGIPFSYLDGSTRDRAGTIEEFKSGTNPVFLISLKAGGFGLNLTEADYCIVLDPWWNPASEAQAIDRAHRIGQTRTVMVYRLVSAGTIEEKVMAMKASKAALFDSVMTGAAASPKGLTAEDIRNLLA